MSEGASPRGRFCLLVELEPTLVMGSNCLWGVRTSLRMNLVSILVWSCKQLDVSEDFYEIKFVTLSMKNDNIL